MATYPTFLEFVIKKIVTQIIDQAMKAHQIPILDKSELKDLSNELQEFKNRLKGTSPLPDPISARDFLDKTFATSEIDGSEFTIDIDNAAYQMERYADLKVKEALSQPTTRAIDKVTVTNLGLACRMANIQSNDETLDRIIDLVELLEDKGDDVSISDITRLQELWKK